MDMSAKHAKRRPENSVMLYAADGSPYLQGAVLWQQAGHGPDSHQSGCPSGLRHASLLLLQERRSEGQGHGKESQGSAEQSTGQLPELHCMAALVALGLR